MADGMREQRRLDELLWRGRYPVQLCYYTLCVEITEEVCTCTADVSLKLLIILHNDHT